MRSLRRFTITKKLSTKARPRSSASSPKIGPSLRRRGFTTLRIFFSQNHCDQGVEVLCQPLAQAATMIVLEFYANLASNMNKRVRVCGVWVDFYPTSINEFYNLEPVDSREFDSLYAALKYLKILRELRNGQGEWKLNSEGHTIHIKARQLAYIPKVWHHFITSRLIPTTNDCEVTAKPALLNFSILQDIPFDVGQVIEDAILHNKYAKMNLGHPFLIFGLCKKAGEPLEHNEAWIHPIFNLQKLEIPKLKREKNKINQEKLFKNNIKLTKKWKKEKKNY